MPKIKINKNKNYTVMSNIHLRDKRLSLKAKGLLSMMFSLPDDWDYSVGGLVSICIEGKKSIQATLKELEGNGYLIRERTRDKQGKFEYIYNVFEEPQHHKGCTDNPLTVNPFTAKPCTDNGVVYKVSNKSITNKSNKDILNNQSI